MHETSRDTFLSFSLGTNFLERFWEQFGGRAPNDTPLEATLGRHIEAMMSRRGDNRRSHANGSQMALTYSE